MANHPINLGFRFLLELGILAGLALWGWQLANGPWRLATAILIPVAAALVWGTFRVPGDPGDATVAVPGAIRLLLELSLFAAGTWAYYAAGHPRAGLIFGLLVLFHYAISYDRIIWLLTPR
jgi:hypothetical protein